MGAFKTAVGQSLLSTSTKLVAPHHVYTQRREQEEVALCVRDQLGCTELHLRMEEEPTSWVRIKEGTGTGDIIVTLRAVKALGATQAGRQRGVSSHPQALVLVGDFDHPNNSWGGSTVGHNQPRRCLECIVGNSSPSDKDMELLE